MELPRLQLRLVDNNGGVSRPGFYLPEGTPPADALSFANALRSAVLPLTLCQLQGGALTYDLGIEPSGPAALDSDCHLNLLLFYSTGQNHGSLAIPSPRQLAYDLADEWQGFRLTRASAITSGLLSDIENLVTGTVFRFGQPFPNTFTVGALDTIVPV